jgi:transcriptional regulator of arginine metabolism
MTLDAAILRLLAQHEVVDQSHLLSLLQAEGHDLTQPTLSRHLKKLSIQKKEGRYQRVEAGAAGLPPFTVKAAPPNLLILRTLPGFAQALAYTLDQRQLPHIAGSVAGDDTIFLAVEGPEYLAVVRERLDMLSAQH